MLLQIISDNEPSCFEYFCSFLSNQDCVQLLSSSTRYATKWLKQLRIIVIRNSPTQFFHNKKFRQQVLSKIQDPRKQLDIILGYFDEIRNQSLQGFHCPGIRRWHCSVELFEKVMSKVGVGNFETIESLKLYGGEKPTQAVKYLSRVRTSLCLVNESLPSRLDFLSPTLEELELMNMDDDDDDDDEAIATSGLVVPALPQLRKLAICGVQVENLPELMYVKNVVLMNLPIILQECDQANCLTIEDCSSVIDFSMVQNNRKVAITGCSSATDLSRCFRNTVVINLTYYEVNSALHVDLSYYQQCRRFSLKLGPRVLLYREKLSSENVVPTSLKFVQLHGLNHQVPLDIFRSVSLLELAEVRVDLALQGLEQVPTVILRDMNTLTSLAGLGQNQKVMINNCPKVTDFSALRHVNNVEVFFCRGFRDVSQVDHVQHLKISYCSNLKDASWLGKIPYDPVTESYPMQSLSFLRCEKLRSIQGVAAVIPSLSCEDCPNLRRHDGPIVRKSSSNNASTQLSTGILSLPDSLYGTILDYVEYQEVVQFLSTTPYLYDTLMRKYRAITIRQEVNYIDFFTDPQMRAEVLRLIEEPSEQLRFSFVDPRDSERESFAEEISADLPSLLQLQIVAEMFLQLCVKQQGEDWSIRELILYENDGKTMLDGTSLLPYLKKGKDTLVLQRICFPPKSLQREHFASSIQELSIRYCCQDDNSSIYEEEDEEIYLPVLPNLKKLTVEHSFVSNLKDFHYLQELELKELHYLDSVEAFSNIPCLRLIELENVVDIKCLQQNQEVEIRHCGVINFTRGCLAVKRLTIELWRLLEEEDVVSLDLSHFQELQEFTLDGNHHGSFATNEQNQQLCSQASLPASLKIVTLSYVSSFSRTNIYHSVHTLCIEGCPKVVSVEGLGSVQVLTLRGLSNLTSLQGLQAQQTNKKKTRSSSSDITSATDRKQENKIVLIERCDKIKDFSPLRTVPKVTIKECKGFRNGYDVDGVKDLTLQECPEITDISMLVLAERLRVIDCKGVKKKGRVPEIVPDF